MSTRSTTSRRLGSLGAIVLAAALAVTGCSAEADPGTDPSPTNGSSDVALPTGNLTVITPYAAGGTTDIAARALAASIEASSAQTVVVENKPGASGIVGTTEAAAAGSSGNTVMLAVGNVFTQSKLRETSYSFDSFEGIRGIFAQAYLLVVPADSPHKTFDDLAEAKSVTFAVSGWGDAQHLGSTMIYDQLGVEATAIPFDGNAQSTQAILGGNVDASLGATQTFIPLIEAGNIRALAVLTPDRQRLDYLPDVPTLDELGVDTSDFILPYWGVAAPAGTPAGVTQAWSDAFGEALRTPDFQKFAEDNFLILLDDDEAATWYDDERTSADRYATLLNEFDITIQ